MFTTRYSQLGQNMKRIFTFFALVIGIFATSLVSAPTATAAPDPTHPGTWSVVADCPGINPIHSAELPSGKFLFMAGSGYNKPNSDAIKDGTMKVEQAWTYDPSTPTVCPKEVELPVGVDLFCAGMTHLPDGRILVFGGTGNYGGAGSAPGLPNYYTGIKDTYVFNEIGNTFTKLDDMAVGRWYGTGVSRSNGNIDVFGGLGENAEWTQNHQMFDAATMKWVNLVTPPWKLPMYAGSALTPGGTIAYTGTYFGNANGATPMVWNPNNYTSTPIAGLPLPTCRNQANTQLVYPKVYVIAGGCATGVTSSWAMLDMGKAPMAFTNMGYNGMAGMHQCAATLPDKSVFVSGGTNHNNKTTAMLAAKRLAFNGTTWQSLATPTVKRGYHSTCLVAKDGKVITMGTNWNDGIRETKIEVYSPWYAQAGVVRPYIFSTTAAKNGCVSVLPKATLVKVRTNIASTVVAGTLQKIQSTTHQHDPNNRLVPISVTQTAPGYVQFTPPAPSAVYPAGLYRLSLLGSNGAPSASVPVSIGGVVSKHAACCC